jgi:hypothetical protein
VDFIQLIRDQNKSRKPSLVFNTFSSPEPSLPWIRSIDSLQPRLLSMVLAEMDNSLKELIIGSYSYFNHLIIYNFDVN